jgi:hypothetical protein
LATLIAELSLAWSHPASAGPITLAYEAPWECPDREFFWRQLRARSLRVTQIPGEPGALAVTVKITNLGGRYAGHVMLQDNEGSNVERDFGSSVCLDVSNALALAAAIALDASLVAPKPLVFVAQKPNQPPQLGVGLVGGIHGAVAPGTRFTPGFAVSWRPHHEGYASEYRLEALAAWSGRIGFSDSSASARLLWLAARAAACPYQLRLATTALGPCVAAEIGALRGSGADTNNARAQTGWWFAPGALLNWSMVAGPIWVHANAGPVFPVVRDHFVIAVASADGATQRPREAFRAPAVGLVADVSVAWAFE